MKPYGNYRRDNLCCKYHCCGTGKCHKATRNKVPPAYVRAARKRARRIGRAKESTHE